MKEIKRVPFYETPCSLPFIIWFWDLFTDLKSRVHCWDKTATKRTNWTAF